MEESPLISLLGLQVEVVDFGGNVWAGKLKTVGPMESLILEDENLPEQIIHIGKWRTIAPIGNRPQYLAR